MRNCQTSGSLPAAIAAALIWMTCASSTKHAAFEDPEALYFANIPGFKLIELEVTRTTAVFANRNRNGHFANFLKGEKVQLLAYHEQTSLVKHVKNGKSGWVPVEHLSDIDENLLKSALAQAEEEKKYEAAIKEKQVLAGMSLEQVRESVGKPDEVAFRTDANGRTDIWTYFEYKSVYREQTFTDPNTGRLLVRRIKEKVPAAETNIEFLNGRVTAIEKRRIHTS